MKELIPEFFFLPEFLTNTNSGCGLSETNEKKRKVVFPFSSFIVHFVSHRARLGQATAW